MSDILHAAASSFALLVAFDSDLLGIVVLSLGVSLSASAIAMVIGAPLGGLLAISRFRGREAVIVVVNALLGLPPVVVGLAIYLLLSRSGPLGFAGLLFTPAAMVLAQVVLTTPIVIALVHRPVSLLWGEYGELMRLDGLSKGRSLQLLFLIGRTSLLTAFLAAFGRAIAEVGAIMMVGGNIRGSTRTMTTAIALETGKGALELALALGVVLIALSVLVSAMAFVVNARVSDR